MKNIVALSILVLCVVSVVGAADVEQAVPSYELTKLALSWKNLENAPAKFNLGATEANQVVISMAPEEKQDIPYMLMEFALTAGNITDMMITMYALDRGAVERNPASTVSIFKNPAIFVPLSTVIIVVHACLLEGLGEQNKLLGWATGLTLLAIKVLIIRHNIHTLGHL